MEGRWFSRRVIETEQVAKYLFLLPLLFVLLSLTVFPLAYLIRLSLMEGPLNELQFAGLGNYIGLFSDRSGFLQALGRTAVFVALAVSFELVIGVSYALLVRDIVSSILKTVLLLPMLIAPVAVGIIWRIILQTDIGVLNKILHQLGMLPRPWLAVPNLAFLSVLITDIWQWTPFVYLIILAGLKSIPGELYEAAEVDGGTGWTMFRYITLPLLKPSILVAVLFRSISCFAAFDKIMILTEGGPGTATEFVSLWTYKTTFRWLDFGTGAAAAVVLTLVILGYTTLLRRKGGGYAKQ